MSLAGEKWQKEGASGLSLKSCLYLVETLPSTSLAAFAQGTLNIHDQQQQAWHFNQPQGGERWAGTWYSPGAPSHG